MFEHRRIIKDILDLYSIDTSYLIAVGLLHIDDAKNWLIRKEYIRLYNNGEFTYKEVKRYLRERYGVSISCIEKMVYRNLKT